LNRRGFLGAIGAAVAAATLDPERALWIPGAKVYSIPAPRVEVLSVRFTTIFDPMRKRMIHQFTAGRPTPNGWQCAGVQIEKEMDLPAEFDAETRAALARCLGFDPRALVMDPRALVMDPTA
jgi:hypothetical protein